MISSLIPGERSEVSVLEENKALREQLSQSQMDRDQLLAKQAILTDRVGVTGQGQVVENYLKISLHCTNH